MKFGEVIIWLIVFIVGSLIVTFLVSPGSFDSFLNNLNNIKVKYTLNTPAITQTTQTKSTENQTNENVYSNTSKPKIIKLIPSEMNEYGYYKLSYKSCSALETNAEISGVSNILSKVCREACGKKDMNYYSNDCEKDLLICFCK